MRQQGLAVERLRIQQDALEGRIAVVTGGGRGIGREIVRALAMLGASIVVADQSEDGMETERLVNESGGRAFFVRTDTSNEPDVSLLARRAEETFGPADILINGASLCPVASVLETEVALWDRVIAVNLRGAFLACRAFLPGMLRRKHGIVVNVVSIDPLPYMGPCSSSAEGLVGLTKALASEVKDQGVRAVAFAPGMVDTVEMREIAQGLALRFGFAIEDIVDVSPHRPHDGPIPAGHAAAAVAYLVAVLADEYHGQKVSSYTVLERAGFIEPMAPSRQDGGRAADRGASADRAATVPVEVALGKRLQRVIDDTDAEFSRLAIYVRPTARRSFESKTGRTIAEWRAAAANLTALLEKVRASDGAAEETLHASYPYLKDWLGKLIAYYHEAPVELASLTRDAGMLRDVTFYSPQRESSLRFLLGALERLATRAHTISSTS